MYTVATQKCGNPKDVSHDGSLRLRSAQFNVIKPIFLIGTKLERALYHTDIGIPYTT